MIALKKPCISSATFHTVATLALVVTALYVAQDVVLPLAMSILLTFMLTPFVRRLERTRLPRVASVLVVFLTLGFIVSAMFYGMARQLIDMADDLPTYRQNIMAKLTPAREMVAPVMDRISSTVQMLEYIRLAPKDSRRTAVPEDREDLDERPSSAPSSGDLAAEGREKLEGTQDRKEAEVPVPVQIAPNEDPSVTLVKSVLGPTLSPLATAALIAVFTTFMLLEREDLRSRVVVLLGVDRVPGTTQLLDEAGARVGRYLRNQLIVNSAYGAVIGVLCFVAGLPSPIVWGTLAAVFRFVPYLGPLIGSGAPIFLALAVTPGWQTFAVVTLAIVLIELVLNNVIEPWAFGRGAGVSTLGILVSALFWSWLWGTVGLILSTPLTVCIVLLGRHVPALRFIWTLLSEEIPLAPAERLYQRLLAEDTDESLRIVTAAVASSSLNTAFDEVVLPALHRAADDRAAGEIDSDQQVNVLESFDEMWQELALELPSKTSGDEGLPSVMCLPARGLCDGHAARVAELALARAGWHIATAPSRTSMPELVAHMQAIEIETVLVVAIGARAAHRAGYVLRQLRAAGWNGASAALVIPHDSLDEQSLSSLRTVGTTDVASGIEEIALRLRGSKLGSNRTPSLVTAGTLS